MRISSMERSRPFFERYALLILVVAMFLLPLIARGARQSLLSNRNDVGQWLPDTYRETQDFREFRRHFADEQFVLVSWVGCTMDDERLELFTKKIEKGITEGFGPDRKKLFSSITTGPRLIERLGEGQYGLSRDEVIARFSNSLIGPDGKTTCAVITFTSEGAAHGQLRKTVDFLRALLRDECHVKPDELRMGGPPVDNVALDESGEESLYRLAGVSAVVGLVMAWWCLRIPRLIMLVFSCGLYSAMLSLAIVYYTRTDMNAILLTMPTLVYVAAISGAIHLANYYRETVEHEGVRGAPGRALRHAALPLGLATGTTSVGLFTLCWTDLQPIYLFGLYSALGVLASAFVLVTVVPAAMQLWPLPSHSDHAEKLSTAKVGDPLSSRRWRLVGRRIIRHHRLVTVGCFALMIGAGYGLKHAETSINLMRFFSEGSRIRQDYAWLERNLGPLVPMEVVITFEKDNPLSMLDRLRFIDYVQGKVRDMDKVGEAMSAVTFAPPPDVLEQQIAEKSGVGFQVFANSSANDQITRKLDDTGYLRTYDDGTQLWRITARLGALEEIDYGEFVANIQKVVDKAVGDMRAADRDARVAAAEAGEQPAEENDADVFASVNVKYTGLVPLVYKAQHSLLSNLIVGFEGDWALVTVVMIVVLRSLSAGALLMFPAVFPAAIVFGLMGWLGILIDTGTVMTPAVALGVTVDDVVHFMLKFREGLRAGMKRRRAIMLAYEHCAQAMYQSWGVIALGLSVFALSPFMPTQRFGIMMLTLLTASLFGNLVMLPALLASPLGGLFAWTILRRDKKKAAKRAARAVIEPAPEEELATQPTYGAVATRHARFTDSVAR